jgi:hypothetical protein
LSTDGGLLLLAELDRRLGLTTRFARCFRDYRDPDRIEHALDALLRQRIYALAAGHEDITDHDELRKDPLLAVLCGAADPVGHHRTRVADVGSALAGKSTFSRLERSTVAGAPTDRYQKIAADAGAIDAFMLEAFLRASPRPPWRIVLDLDTTDDQVHGNQEGRFFHHHYHGYCYLALYIFRGEQLLLAKLLPGNADQRQEVLPHLARLVAQLRARWPRTTIVVRADSGFASDALMTWCEEERVEYVLGFPQNSRLVKLAAKSLRKAARVWARTGQTARVFRDTTYKTRRSWTRRRRVVVKGEYMSQGANPRFVVTSLSRRRYSARWVYEALYCQRGEVENRIKEQQLDLFADRTSTACLASNQLRLYFSSVAYLLLQALRRVALAQTELAQAQCGTIRTKLLKIAAKVRVTVRKVWVSLPTGYPYAEIFARAHAAILRC